MNASLPVQNNRYTNIFADISQQHMKAFIPSRRTLLGTRVDLSIYNILSGSTLDYSTDVLIHKGFMNTLRFLIKEACQRIN